MNDVRRYQLIALLAAILALTVAFVHPKQTTAPTRNGNANTAVVNGNTNAHPTNTNTAAATDIAFSTNDLPDADPLFQFTLQLPIGWAAEYHAPSKQIVIFDPRQTGAKRDQLIISYYHNTTYSAPTGTAVAGTTEGSVLADGKDTAVREVQVLTPKAFPDWGSTAHWEYDVRASELSDVYYRFDFSPAIVKSTDTESIQAHVMNSLKLNL